MQPLGDPPWTFTFSERAAWHDVTAGIWWLDEGDRINAAACARVWSRIVNDPNPDPQLYNVLIRLLGQLGLTPATRGKVLQERNFGKDEEDDGL